MKLLRSYLPTWNTSESITTDKKQTKKSISYPLLWTYLYTNYIKLRITSLDIPVLLHLSRHMIPFFMPTF